MRKRLIGCYPGEDGQMMVTFEKGTKGVPVQSLIPEKDRGEAFGDFRVADYFGLAEMVLASPEDWARVGQDPILKTASAETPARISIPPDIDYLNLRLRDGSMDPERTADLFTMVQAYWTAAQNTMALQPGLVAALWRAGMAPEAIIQSIRQFTGPDGKLIPATGRGPEILFTVIDVYRETKGLPGDGIVPQPEMEALMTTWATATRSVPVPSKDASNEVLHWADYRRLGLVDDAGRADLDRTRRVAFKVLNSDPTPTFEDLVAWTDSLNPKPVVPPAAKAAQAKLKKKRKQARLNRKRGRR